MQVIPETKPEEDQLEFLVSMARTATNSIQFLEKELLLFVGSIWAPRRGADNGSCIWRNLSLTESVLAVTLFEDVVILNSHTSHETK